MAKLLLGWPPQAVFPAARFARRVALPSTTVRPRGPVDRPGTRKVTINYLSVTFKVNIEGYFASILSLSFVLMRATGGVARSPATRNSDWREPLPASHGCRAGWMLSLIHI